MFVRSREANTFVFIKIFDKIWNIFIDIFLLCTKQYYIKLPGFSSGLRWGTWGCLFVKLIHWPRKYLWFQQGVPSSSTKVSLDNLLPSLFKTLPLITYWGSFYNLCYDIQIPSFPIWVCCLQSKIRYIFLKLWWNQKQIMQRRVFSAVQVWFKILYANL